MTAAARTPVAAPFMPGTGSTSSSTARCPSCWQHGTTQSAERCSLTPSSASVLTADSCAGIWSERATMVPPASASSTAETPCA
ncbi:hypothetical protein G6F57_023722 [Rhizopus arrhizus]|nr:hypothetical protein G6F57_023722 [Rhizopus arrhizus]